MTLPEHAQQLIDERAYWLAGPPDNLPEFARRLFEESGLAARKSAADDVEQELREAYALLAEALG